MKSDLLPREAFNQERYQGGTTCRPRADRPLARIAQRWYARASSGIVDDYSTTPASSEKRSVVMYTLMPPIAAGCVLGARRSATAAKPEALDDYKADGIQIDQGAERRNLLRR